jgi:hypothetical protein
VAIDSWGFLASDSFVHVWFITNMGKRLAAILPGVNLKPYRTEGNGSFG